MTPVLLPIVSQLLQQLESASLPLPSLAAAACKALDHTLANETSSSGFEEALVQIGVLEGSPGEAGNLLLFYQQGFVADDQKLPPGLFVKWSAVHWRLVKSSKSRIEKPREMC